MFRATFTVPTPALDPVLDGLLPALPDGVFVEEGEERCGLAVLSLGEPARASLEAVAGRPLDDWRVAATDADARRRRAAGGVRVGRIVVRAPSDGPPAGDLVDVVVEPRSAVFGSGTHPTTRMCLDLLQRLAPAGGIADVGCGLGTLALAAARLGWSPVLAYDREVPAAEATHANAALNGVDVDVRVADLSAARVDLPPTLLVNAAPEVQGPLLDQLPAAVHTAVVSSFMAAEADGVVALWEAAGFRVRERREEDLWVALTLVRDGAPEPLTAPEDHVIAPAAVPEPPPGPAWPLAELLDPAGAVERAGALRQLASRLPDGGLVVSSSRTVEVGARAAAVMVPGLFRFDVTPRHETLGIALRALAPVANTWEADADTYDGFRRGQGDPIMFRGRFDFDHGRVGVWVQAMTISDDDQGAAHLIAKAAVRPVDEDGRPA